MLKEEIYLSSSVEETIALGESFSKNLQGGEIIALYGELGAGKTHFVKGIGRAFGIKREITSPTFIISQSYTTGSLNLIHIDLYRINSFYELEDLGWYDFLDKKSVIVIEWAEKIEEELKNYRVIKVYINYEDENRRKIKIVFPKD